MQGVCLSSNIIAHPLEKKSGTCRSRGASTGTLLGRRQLGMRLVESGTTTFLEEKSHRNRRHNGINTTIECIHHSRAPLAMTILTEAETKPIGGTTTLLTETSVLTRVAAISTGTGDRTLPSSIHSVALRRQRGDFYWYILLVPAQLTGQMCLHGRKERENLVALLDTLTPRRLDWECVSYTHTYSLIELYTYI
jgi:hypothetical protein